MVPAGVQGEGRRQANEVGSPADLGPEEFREPQIIAYGQPGDPRRARQGGGDHLAARLGEVGLPMGGASGSSTSKRCSLR